MSKEVTIAKVGKGYRVVIPRYLRLAHEIVVGDYIAFHFKGKGRTLEEALRQALGEWR